MSEQEWEQFGELLRQIVDLPGSWQEKAEQVKSNVDSTSLSEFCNWFADSE